jgi:hypothetical protein
MLVVDNPNIVCTSPPLLQLNMTSSSDPDPILPLAEQSTLEEDYFADLLLDDDPDEVVIPTGREMRMNRAFADSKRIYRKRDALTEPGVSCMLSLDISRIVTI